MIHSGLYLTDPYHTSCCNHNLQKMAKNSIIVLQQIKRNNLCL